MPLEVLVNKFSHMRFEPMGHTANPDIRIAKSVVDYIFRWLGNTFLPGFREASIGLNPAVSDEKHVGYEFRQYGRRCRTGDGGELQCDSQRQRYGRLRRVGASWCGDESRSGWRVVFVAQ